jgi:crotonobetainyl-CoA:carnitine CoA-transferase CaiB-like acyl-CoA transferase
MMLTPYRALDLTNETGLFCGKVLADLGADVIQVENPQGNHARSIPPFLGDTPHPEKSLFWFAFSAGKRSVTLDLDTGVGKSIFMRLCKTADFVIESFPVGYLENAGLDYEVLSKINPGLIMASITPFGAAGPYKAYKAGDLVASAMGGMVYCTGDPDRAPLRIGIDQAYCQAGVHTAVGLLLALHDRAVTGRGQHVDVSLQASMVRTLHTQLPYWEYSHHIVQRSGSRRFRGGAATREIWPCKDGFVSWMFFGGAVGTQQMQTMIGWMAGKGMAGALGDTSYDWSTLDLTKVSPDTIRSWEQIIGNFFLAHTKNQLYEEALAKRIPLTPVNAISDVVEDEQLTARNFWVSIDHPELGTGIRYPGALFLTADKTCTPGIRRHAPLLGEHNEEVYVRELGMSLEEMSSFRRGGVI